MGIVGVAWGAFDAHRAIEAEQLQAKHPGWVIIWGLYHRTFTAWHGGDPIQVRTVESDDPRELVELITQAEAEATAALPAHRPPYSSGGPRTPRGVIGPTGRP